MLFKTIILDSVLQSGGEPGATSILTLPLGTQSMLEHLCDSAGDIGCTDFLVVTRVPENVSILQRLAERIGQSVTVELANDVLPGVSGLEPSDRIIMIDPRHWPTAGFDFKKIANAAASFPGAIHVVAMGADATDANERVVKSADDRIERVLRFYNQVTQVERPRGAVSYACLPAAALIGVTISEIADIPKAMAARGILAQDIPVRCDLVDAAKPVEYLALCEWKTHQAVSDSTPQDFSRTNGSALVGRGALIHESARLVGPVVVQSGALIGPNATVIGPSVIGRLARVEAGSMVAQAVIGEEGVVKAGMSVRHKLCDRMAADTHSNNGHAYTAFEDAEFETFAPVVREAEQDHRWFQRAKRCVDLSASFLGLLFLSPLLLLVALIIKIDSRGPVFFVHQREGRFGRLFGCLKFRTMRSDAHLMQRKMLAENDLDGPHFKIARDPRITRIGHFLRKTNIDELPQLWNVLVGHMSLVGPRPSPFRENQICVPWRRARLSVRPGITGIWQICRNEREHGDFQQWIYYDLLYVRNMSIWLDTKILFATLATLIGGKEIRSSDLVPERRCDISIEWERPTFESRISSNRLVEAVAN